MIRRTIAAGEEIPRFYGVAWWQLNTRQVVCYPIPLHYVIARLRDWYVTLKYHRGRRYLSLDEATQIASRAYQAGYSEGTAAAKHERKVALRWGYDPPLSGVEKN